MKNWYRSYDVPWDKYEWLDIANIVIEDGVTSIGKFAFSHCDHLISIFIHDGVMSIGADALPVCSYKICFEKCNIKRNTDKAWLSQYFRLLCVSSYLILN